MIHCLCLYFFITQNTFSPFAKFVFFLFLFPISLSILHAILRKKISKIKINVSFGFVSQFFPISLLFFSFGKYKKILFKKYFQSQLRCCCWQHHFCLTVSFNLFINHPFMFETCDILSTTYYYYFLNLLLFYLLHYKFPGKEEESSNNFV